MSDKLAMTAIDKVKILLTLPVELDVRIRKMCEKSGVSRSALINSLLDEGLDRANIQLSVEDYKIVNEIIQKNAADRAAKKVEKGIK